MTYVIYGAVGAIAVLLLLLSGAIIGWKAHGVYTAHLAAMQPAAPEPRQPTPEEVRQFMEDQEAFSTMLHYSPEIAYGFESDPLQEMARKET